MVNSLTLLIGVFLLGLAGYIHMTLGLWVSIRAMIIGLYALGGVISFVSLLGLCGTVSSSRNSLRIYNTFLILLIVAQIGFAITALVFMSTEMSAEMHKTLEGQFNTMTLLDRQSLESQLMCCGYETITTDCGYVPPVNAPLPATCKVKISNIVKLNMKYIMTAVFSVAAFEILLVILGCFLSSKLKAEKKEKFDRVLINEARTLNRPKV